MIVDQAHIHVQSGRGGDGVISFLREKFVAKGGPNGGDGGNGGEVILIADPQIDTLLDFAGRHHWRAEKGFNGEGKQKHGRAGADLKVLLPPGTLVYDAETGKLLVDLDEPGKQFVIAKGGRGGFGNEHFKSPTNQAPRQTTQGEAGEQFDLRLELKLIADIGLVGKPNAGKSTLLSRISKATPKIADYPFTTLEPNLGIAELTGHRRLVIADIPGLIEGASEGAGLGAQFLRHVERTKVLVHLIEVQPTDDSDPVQNYRIIRTELAQHTPELAQKHELVALSKMDLVGKADPQGHEAMVQRIESQLKCKVFAISAATGEGLSALLEACWRVLDKDSDGKGQSSSGQRW